MGNGMGEGGGMRTSARGVAQLEADEGVVLRAYRCPAGVWTIGAGLTAASGVVKPVSGMTITRDEASRLLALALERNYEPAVRAAMPGAAQHEFDAGVSFHFNTGAIGRASWVGHWRLRDWPRVEAAIMAWTKGGGRVLPGLVRRRRQELALLRDGTYHVPAVLAPVAAPVPQGERYARFVLALDEAERAAARAGFAALGYSVGTDPDRIALNAVTAFQTDNRLTVDGLIGRATLSTLQRHLDARRAAAATAGVSVVAAAEAGTDVVADAMSAVPLLGELLLGATAVRALALAWTHRDILAALVTRRLPPSLEPAPPKPPKGGD